MLLRFPAQSKTRRRHRRCPSNIDSGLALVTLKYRRMMLAHRLHDLSRTSPPTLIGRQADRGSSRGTVQRDASGFRPTERGIRSHSSRAVREHLFSAKGAIYIFKQDKRLYPGPSGEDAGTFRPTSRCRIAVLRESVRAGIRGPGFHAQLISGPPSELLCAHTAARCTVRHEEEYHGRIDLPIRSRSLNFLLAAVIVTKTCCRRLLPRARLLRSPTVSWRLSNEASC